MPRVRIFGRGFLVLGAAAITSTTLIYDLRKIVASLLHKGVLLILNETKGKDLPSSPSEPKPPVFLATAAIALGSNLPSRFGQPAENLREAIHRLGALGKVTAVSSFHETKPVGFLDQPDFTNAVALLETELDPLELLHSLLAVEQVMGRDRSAAMPAKGPRVIDLDLLLYGNLILSGPELTLPHPAMHDRRFVLEPLTEIAPSWIHPSLCLTMRELLQHCQS